MSHILSLKDRIIFCTGPVYLGTFEKGCNENIVILIKKLEHRLPADLEIPMERSSFKVEIFEFFLYVESLNGLGCHDMLLTLSIRSCLELRFRLELLNSRTRE
jgi:hypothetical protein